MSLPFICELHTDTIRTPPCLYVARLKPMLRDARLIRQCKRGVLQFVIMKPAFALISVLMLGLSMYHTAAYQVFMLTVYNISYSVALYSLFVFYLATKVRIEIAVNLRGDVAGTKHSDILLARVSGHTCVCS
jgi:hypothetical protein